MKQGILIKRNKTKMNNKVKKKNPNFPTLEEKKQKQPSIYMCKKE